nr:MAG TPA: hypothetical protein [Caudoviricetes sp.]
MVHSQGLILALSSTISLFIYSPSKLAPWIHFHGALTFE